MVSQRRIDNKHRIGIVSSMERVSERAAQIYSTTRMTTIIQEYHQKLNRKVVNLKAVVVVVGGGEVGEVKSKVETGTHTLTETQIERTTMTIYSKTTSTMRMGTRANAGKGVEVVDRVHEVVKVDPRRLLNLYWTKMVTG